MALDPKSAATIAKIAIQAVKDDETRNKIIFISMAPIISVLLMCARHGTNLAGERPASGIYRQV